MAISKHTQTTGAARKSPRGGTNITRTGIKMTPGHMELLEHYKGIRGKYSPQMTVDSFLRKAQELKLSPEANLHMLTADETAILNKRLGKK